MYLHLGQDTVIHTEDIIGIFDLDNASVAKATKQYLAQAEKRGQVVNVSYEIPKSFVVCVRDGITKVYISQISTATLLKRTDFIRDIANIER